MSGTGEAKRGLAALKPRPSLIIPPSLDTTPLIEGSESAFTGGVGGRGDVARIIRSASGSEGTTGFTGRGGRNLLLTVSLGDRTGVARPDDSRADTAARGLGGGDKNDDPSTTALLLRIVALCDDTNGPAYCGGLVIERGLMGREPTDETTSRA